MAKDTQPKAVEQNILAKIILPILGLYELYTKEL
jgi:hypothetical protein